VYVLIEEAEMMENLGIVLPGEIQMLLAKKNSLFDDIMKVKNMIYSYNSFISVMSDLEVSNKKPYFYIDTSGVKKIRII
jgi:hypothetical protein